MTTTAHTGTIPTPDAARDSAASPAAASAARLPAAAPRRSGPVGRILSLARGELLVLRRNSVAAFYAVAMSPMLVVIMTTLPFWEDISPHVGASMGVRVLAMLAVFGVVMAVYFNLTTAAVARRESSALKRQISGTARPWEVLTALAAPNVVVLLLQVALGVAVVAWRLELPALTNPAVAVVGLLLGAAVFALAAYVTSTFTRTAEAAQLTTMPMMLVGFVVSGVLLPMSILPDSVRTVMELLPVLPVNELITIGVGGTTLTGEPLTLAETFTHAARPLGVLLVWTGLLASYVGRKMVYDSRR